MIYLNSLLALLAVLGLVWLLYRLLLRFQDRLPGMGRQRRIQVLERSPLGDKRNLLLVEVDGRQLLLGATIHQISILAEIAAEQEGLGVRGSEFGLQKLDDRRKRSADRSRKSEEVSSGDFPRILEEVRS